MKSHYPRENSWYLHVRDFASPQVRRCFSRSPVIYHRQVSKGITRGSKLIKSCKKLNPVVAKVAGVKRSEIRRNARNSTLFPGVCINFISPVVVGLFGKGRRKECFMETGRQPRRNCSHFLVVPLTFVRVRSISVPLSCTLILSHLYTRQYQQVRIDRRASFVYRIIIVSRIFSGTVKLSMDWNDRIILANR